MTTMSGARSTASPTMLDVAHHAGVSLKTVSRVVNREPGVAAPTRDRVRTAIEQLGFRRHDGASQLRSGRTATIGLVVEDLADPFYSALAAAVERVARRHDYVLLTASAEGSVERETEVVDTFRARRVAGLVVVPAGSDHSRLATVRPGDPAVVFVDRPPAGLDADCVLTDNEGGVRTAVDHLAALGHRRIGYLGDDPAFWTAGRRRQGFLDAVAALGLAGDAVEMGPYHDGRLAHLLAGWTTGDPAVTALVTGNNRVTVEAVRALRGLSRPPAVVGFDDFELADLLQPSVTVVAQDPSGLGERAAHRLLDRISGVGGPARTQVLPVRLLVRDSSGPPRGTAATGPGSGRTAVPGAGSAAGQTGRRDVPLSGPTRGAGAGMDVPDPQPGLAAAGQQDLHHHDRHDRHDDRGARR